MSDPSGAGRAFLDRLAELLQIERAEEEARTQAMLGDRSRRELASSGVALLGLEVSERRWSGLEERLELTLSRGDRRAFDSHSLSPGSRVVVVRRGEDSGGGLAATVTAVGSSEIAVLVDHEPEDGVPGGAYDVVQTSDDVTHRRMAAALGRLARSERGRVAQLVRSVVLGETSTTVDEALAHALVFRDVGLDASQRAAVRQAISACDVALVHGPPGTGKTRTLIEIIAQAVARGESVLATAPANVAVDNLVERLVAAGIEVVRLGHPARVRAEFEAHTFSARVAARMDADLLRTMRAEERALIARLAKGGPGMREARDELRVLRRDLRAQMREARGRALDEAAVVLATCTGAADHLLSGRTFDLVVIDEAGQCVEPLAYVPLETVSARGRLVMAGDHRQLPPTVLSPRAARAGLAVSLFERLASRTVPSAPPATMLEVQYRMNEAIGAFVSTSLYEGRLVADPSVAQATLGDLPPLMFVDTAGAGHDESRRGERESLSNPGEADVLVRHLEALLERGIAPTDIAVIAPYAAQVDLLRERAARPGLEIDTVDAFQGREKPAVLVSLVRSNPEGELGFLNEVRRLNVAISRAQRHLFVIGDSATLARHPFYAAFIDHAAAAGQHESVFTFAP